MPNWERAKERKQGRYAIVEMPIKTKGKVLFLDAETKERMNRESDRKAVRNSARLIIQRDLETGEMRSFISVFMGTYDYLKRTDRIHKNSYFKRDKNFEGDVNFYKLDGSLINGWRYRKGKIVARITPADEPVMTAFSSTTGGANSCSTVPVWVEVEDCEQDSYLEWDEEWGEDVVNVDVDCEPKWEVQYQEVCDDAPETPDEPTGPPGNDNGSGNGNGSGSGTNPGYVDPTPTNPNPGGGTQQTTGDREPISYNWRPKLAGNNFDSHLQKTTPLYIYNSNGELIGNPEAFNCHYHTFSVSDPDAIIGTLAADGMPKWVIQVNLVNWTHVSSNIQVGDVIMYYGSRGSFYGWTHSGIVTEVDAQGYATEISSKMGEYEIITHHPRDIPPEYGETGTKTVFGGISYPSRAYYRKK